MVDYAATGFAAFAVSTLLLQLHNLGLCGVSPVICVGFVFGGVFQSIIGCMAGNTFASTAFIGYGTFWIILSMLLVLKETDAMVVSKQDLGAFLMVYTVFTFILWLDMVRTKVISNIVLFSFLLLSFVLLVISEFEEEGIVFKKSATWFLVITSGCAFYKMTAHLMPIRLP